MNTRPQPAPIPNGGTPVWDLVIDDVTGFYNAAVNADVKADMRARDALGRARYGTPLQTNNGRNALQDAYEEALDLVVYLRQAIEERDEAEYGLTDLCAIYRRSLRTVGELRAVINKEPSA